MVRSGGQQRRGGGAADTHERPEGSPSRTQKNKQRRAAARGDQGSGLITRGSIAGLSEEAADATMSDQQKEAVYKLAATAVKTASSFPVRPVVRRIFTCIRHAHRNGYLTSK
eukprot:COSAG03_NODE_10543_length_644_cov_1.638532_1_plen_111_part_10